MENTPIIEFKNVTKRFGCKMILDQINLKIYEGQVTTVIGKSGAGKSVLLKHIIGLLKPDEGAILFKGRSFERMGKDEQNEMMNQISYMFQNNALFDSKTVFENIAMPLRESTHLSEKKIKENVLAEILDVCLIDATERQSLEKLIEVDTTDKDVEETVNEILERLKEGNGKIGTIDWLKKIEFEGRLKDYL